MKLRFSVFECHFSVFAFLRSHDLNRNNQVFGVNLLSQSFFGIDHYLSMGPIVIIALIVFFCFDINYQTFVSLQANITAKMKYRYLFDQINKIRIDNYVHFTLIVVIFALLTFLKRFYFPRIRCERVNV